MYFIYIYNLKHIASTQHWKGDYWDIPIEEYFKNNGTIWIYDPYGEYGDKLFYNGFFIIL